MVQALDETLFGQLPLQDDSKLARACDTCRRRKVKCSGPAGPSGVCISCQKHDTVCTYLGGTRKRGPPRGYVQELERRVASLEQQIRAQSASDTSRSTPAASPDCTPVKIRSYEDREVDEITEAMQQWNVSGHYHGRSSATLLFMSMDRMRSKLTGKSSAALAKNRNTCPSFVEATFESETQRELKTHPLPEQDLVDDLVELYFTRVHVINPMLHRPSFMRQLSAGLAATSCTYRALVFAVMASASRYSDDPRTLERSSWLGPSTGEAPDAMSKGYSFLFASIRLSFTLAPTSLFTLQALTLLCEYIVHSGSILVAWQIAGWTARMIVTSGAHCLVNAGWNNSLLVDELRKRAFWTFYVLDRNLSLLMGRPFAIPDEIIDVDLPLNLDDTALDYYDQLALPFPRTLPNQNIARSGNLLIMMQLATLARLYERVVEVLYMGHPTGQQLSNNITALDSILRAWIDAVPSDLRWNPANPDDDSLALSGIISCAYYACKMTIYRACVWPSANATLDRFLPLACDAACELSHIVETLRQRGVTLHNWTYLIPGSIQAGLILILSCYVGDTVAPLADDKAASLSRFQSYLRTVAPTTWGAKRCADTLEQCTQSLEEDVRTRLKRPSSDASAVSETLSMTDLPLPAATWASFTDDLTLPVLDGSISPPSSASPNTGFGLLNGGDGTSNGATSTSSSSVFAPPHPFSGDLFDLSILGNTGSLDWLMDPNAGWNGHWNTANEQ